MINRFLTYIKLIGSDKCILKWSENIATSKNIGDALNPYLFDKLFGKPVVNINNCVNVGVFPVFSFVGSVLDNSGVRNLHVLGSGFRNEKSPIFIKPEKVYACRGPLTRKKLLETGVNVPEVYGDPAILLPKYYNPEIEQVYKMGVIPHYVDQDLEIVQKYKDRSSVKLLDVYSPLEQFVSDIKSCEFTISSSLHGVIISQAYGVPSVWVKFSNKIGGGTFKFDDYYKSLNMDDVNIVDLSYKEISTKDLKERALLPDLSHLTTQLYNVLMQVKEI